MGASGDPLRELGALEWLASRDTPVHRLDPRAKVLATLLFILAVSSSGRYEVSALLPFFLFPVVLSSVGGVPWGLVGRRALVVLPFALALGGLNPVLDSGRVALGSLEVSAGWISLLSILVRSLLCASAAVILVATTPVSKVCMAFERLGVPAVLALQIGMLYRYLFVLLDESRRMSRAREARANGQALRLAEYGPLAGSLLVRTWERARRIHIAMSARGFEGEARVASMSAFRGRDFLFVAAWGAVFLLLRLVNAPHLLENLLKGAWS